MGSPAPEWSGAGAKAYWIAGSRPGAIVENKRYRQAKAQKLGHLFPQNIEH
jgi:hypothetical protein